MVERIICAHALDGLKQIESGTIDTCITSPPYYNLRNYGSVGQIGLEATPEEYIDKLVAVFREVKRVLRDDGTLWLNISDTFAGHGKFANCKSKDLIGIPWLLAFALRADGWYLRSDIIWQKGNCMPESVTDRPTRSHEYIFLLSKSSKYYYDHEAIKEPAVNGDPDKPRGSAKSMSGGKAKVNSGRRKKQDEVGSRRYTGFNERYFNEPPKQHRNKRSVWNVNTTPFPGAHFATFPKELIRPCILAGSRFGGIILDPFFGAGTTGLVAMEEGRRYVGIEINPEYVEIAQKRLNSAIIQPKLREPVSV